MTPHDWRWSPRTRGEAARSHVRDGHPCEHVWRVATPTPWALVHYAWSPGCGTCWIWSEDLEPRGAARAVMGLWGGEK